MEMRPDRDNEEYRFSEEQPSGSQNPPPPRNPMEKVGRQTIFTVIGVLVALFFIYRFISSFFGETPPKKPVTPAPVVQAPVQVVTPPPPPPGLDAESKARMAKSEEEITQLQATSSSMQDQLVAINNMLQDISRQLKLQQDQIVALQPKPIEVRRRVVRTYKRQVQKQLYYIKALVPGRAWLTDQKGSTLTVSVGDQLRGYGVVNDIDVNQGAITTSTGDIIRFRPDDS